MCAIIRKDVLEQFALTTKLSRNAFFILVIILIGLVDGAPLKAQTTAQKEIRIRINPESAITPISPDFIGFGYETSAVAQPNYFSADNTKLINLYRNLSTQGMIRIGGIISDHTKYVMSGTPAARTQDEVTVINRANLNDLSAFAKATGWKIMWGLNLGTGTQLEAVEEAEAVTKAFGSRLHSFEIGNEVDFISGFNKEYSAYYKAYRSYKKAIREVLPAAPFSGPDVAWNIDWLKNFARTQADDIKLLTKHYYRGGGKDSASTIQKLLKTDQDWIDQLKKLNSISQKYDVGYRINEVNSFYGGGKEGVSDTFASALWCLDYMYLLASHGSKGINIETDVNQLGWISHYSPIIHDSSGKVEVRPEYYGMLAFSMAAKGSLVKLHMEKTDINLSVYATKPDGQSLWVTLINKDLKDDAPVNIQLPRGYSKAQIYRLEAPSVKSKQHVTLAGAQVSADGKWKPGLRDAVSIDNGAVSVVVPHASAVLVRFQKSGR